MRLGVFTSRLELVLLRGKHVLAAHKLVVASFAVPKDGQPPTDALFAVDAFAFPVFGTGRAQEVVVVRLGDNLQLSRFDLDVL